MENHKLKYRESDFYKISNAFLRIYNDHQEGDTEGWVEALQTLTNYPTKVLETFVKSVLALNLDDKETLTESEIMATKIYILLRMNLCEL